MLTYRLRIIGISIALLTPFSLFAQFTDNFSDGDFTQNPTWTGNTELFSVENFQLRLNSSAGKDSTFLITPSFALNNTEWNFWVKLAFTPSDNNHPKIYLVSNSSNLKGSLNGYYIQIGKTGTDNKRIYLFRQDGLMQTEIMVGANNLATSSNNILRIKVLRNNSGHWEVFADPQGGNLFAPEGSANDATHTNASYFGIFCKYTSSNINRLYFDDFYVGDILVDTIPPVITSAQAISQQNLALHYSEAVDPASATNMSSYSVNQGIGSPSSIIQDISNPARLILDFSSVFNDGQVYTLTVQGVKDLALNTMDPASIDFSYYTVRPYDIVINEIMADPTPEVGLPPHEYIELFNTTPFTINLAGWIFRHGTTNHELPAVSIAGNAYLILGTEAAIAVLAQYGSAAVVAGLSSTALTNLGITITLYDPQNTIIHSVSYSDEWYKSSSKKQGGWSLEMIDPGNPCSEANNWIASIDLRGGTPGIINSVEAANPDLEKPWLNRAVISDANTLTLYFSEKMDQAGIANSSNFIINKGMGNPLIAMPFEPRFDAVNLVFSEVFAEQTVYEVSITGTLSDCTGNPIETGTTARFAYPVFTEPNDLVINEILFNPPTGGIEYVEIYNRSQKVIDLKNVRLASQDTIMNQLTSVREIAPAGYLVFPEDYLVLTTSPDLVKEFFMTTNPRGFIKMLSVPQFGNTSGIAVLCDPNEKILDRLAYHEEMHFPLLTNVKGVSLERIDFNRPADDPTNWHSASSSSGYGTPAYRNSQYMAITAGEEPFILNPEIFSPDNDGNNDVLEISYNFTEPGFVATIMIYDAGGRLVRSLVQNQLLGNAGSFSWNGFTNDNEKAPIGYYLILIEVFDLNDNIKQYKKTAVLGGRL